MPGTAAETLHSRLDALRAVRTEANRDFFAAEAERLARCCHSMAERFARGGRLVALGRSPVARSDARHVAVEFVHPVIVGKRALPALALAGEGGSLEAQVRAVVEPGDIAIGYGIEEPDELETRDAIAVARELGCLTIAFGPGPAEWEFEPRAPDSFVRQELVETLYHVLWELVHVFFEHRGLLEGRETGPVHDTGASSFLYPFLSESEADLEGVIEDVRASILMKAQEVGSLREQTLAEGGEALLGAADELRRARDAGARVLAMGNGGSATDAMDFVADLRATGLRSIDLTEDASILTAIANDIGVEEIFQRQVIAYGHEGDIAVALSTSGNSANLIEALTEARGRRLTTLAFVGYDGGRIASDGLADHVVVTRSQHIPRIQEAQASAYHALVELIRTPEE
ncbi:MAG TPA: SIS domain-containing protein [Solirubrobacterales bacterium]|jgi:D-sedoheptulose 7-phosphate isomerase|nr:SIS domain-containing protein [Solirubrobacterales bacterium]